MTGCIARACAWFTAGCRYHQTTPTTRAAINVHTTPTVISVDRRVGSDSSVSSRPGSSGQRSTTEAYPPRPRAGSDLFEHPAPVAGEALSYAGPTGREESDVAELQLDGGELVLHLSGAEKAEAVHGDLRVPLSALHGVEVLDDAHGWTGIGVGFKVGMRVPGVATMATVRGHGEKIFVAVHGDTPRGVRVRLDGAPWDEWIVGCADPEAVAGTPASAS